MNTNNPKKLADEFFSTNNEETLLKILLQFLNLLSSGDRHKKDIFLNLSDKGLNKLLSLLKANNAEVRKNSFKVIVNLLSGSEILQNLFCEKYNFNPIGNVIVINWLPSELKNKFKLNEHTLYEIKKTQNDNLNGSRTFWQWPPNPKYNKDNYPDPQKYLLGIYCANQNMIPMEEQHFDDEFDIDALVKELEEDNASS